MSGDGAIKVQLTETFVRWFSGLKDEIAKRAVQERLRRLELALFGDTKSLGAGLHELRIATGPGYRVYFLRRGDALVIVLCGGDKGSQTRDIAVARRLAQDVVS